MGHVYGLFKLASGFQNASYLSSQAFSFWVSEKGIFYPPALYAHAGVDLQTAVFAQTRNAAETWLIALEALQTGLFQNLFLRSSQSCRPAMLRKLQLLAEGLHCRVFIQCQESLPHWFFKNNRPLSLRVEDDGKTFSLSPKPTATR